MVDGPGINSAAWWEQVGMVIGRTESACKSRFKLITRKRKQVTNDREILVTSEVQRQCESSGVVDWSQVSQATGLSMHECLELSQYDVGKTSWDYGLDSFSHNMVDCMTSFIEEYYPAPASVNYRAVSNFMWVAMNDCTRIHDETRDRFEWTNADFERATVLRAQGLTFKEVAQQLSPALTQDDVFNALKNYTSHKQVLEPISVGESSEIARLVDEYAGKYPVTEIVDRICSQLNIDNRHDCYSLISTRIAVHPHYQTKLRDIDYNDLASRISTGQTTVKHAAKELDVPRAALNGYLRSLYKKQLPLSWTEEETPKLVDYMKYCDFRPDFVYFSKVIGTKSATFQLLPHHIVKLIANYVAGSSRLLFDGVTTHSDKYKALQMPLLWVCRNFRAFVHPRFCREYRLSLTYNQGKNEALLYSWPIRSRKFDYSTPHLAKELWFRLDIASVYSGQALQLLSVAPYEGGSFPLVYKLTFDLTIDDESSFNLESANNHTDDNDDGWETVSDTDDALTSGNILSLDTAANIISFAQRVKQMVPAVREIDVIPDHKTKGLIQRRNVHALDLVQQLFGIVEKHVVITCGFAPMLMYLDLEPIRDLVHIAFFMDTHFNDIIPLIRRSAHSLQYLDIDVDGEDITGLVRDSDDGGYLEYTCLHTLKISSSSRLVPSQGDISNDVVPFPQLLRLSLLSSYPFSDDVLFRGNAATLEYLTMELRPNTVTMLKNYRVFAPTSHPNLKYVKIESLRRIPNVFATVDEYMQFVLRIEPGASVRVISDLDKYPVDYTHALSMLKDCGSIQILSLPGTPLSFWEAITLVKSLPLLSDLYTLTLTVGELPQGVSMAELPRYVRTTYAPIGKRFRCWHVEAIRDMGISDVDLATCMLSLALACPNFDYVAVDKKYREQFMNRMEKKIDEPEFSQYAPRLRRLLFRGWKGC
ncbi:hypothetical protein GGI14_005717 [Coemansia sp. S680]|nr:hypothetical protein GGI14_005717 [Coemansia sp. S680]